MSEEQVQFPSLTRLRDKAIERKEQALMEEEKNKAEGNTSKRRVRYIYDNLDDHELTLLYYHV
jgi:hypothetical protein